MKFWAGFGVAVLGAVFIIVGLYMLHPGALVVVSGLVVSAIGSQVMQENP